MEEESTALLSAYGQKQPGGVVSDDEVGLRWVWGRGFGVL